MQKKRNLIPNSAIVPSAIVANLSMRMRAALLGLLIVASLTHGQSSALLAGEPPLVPHGHRQDQGVQLIPESSHPAQPAIIDGALISHEANPSTHRAAQPSDSNQVPSLSVLVAPEPALGELSSGQHLAGAAAAAAVAAAAAPSSGECLKLSFGEALLDDSGLCSIDGPQGETPPVRRSSTDENVGTASAQNTSTAGAAASDSPATSVIVVDDPENVEERQNFASSKDGAKIVAVNKEAKKSSSLLDNDGDTFVKNECKAEKWVIIELAQVVNVDEIKLSQHELYSSRVRDFQVRGRMSHPRSDGDYGKNLDSAAWKLLSNFTARKLKGTQTFKVEVGPWVKFLQLRFLTQYGSEPVCAINDIIVHGKSAAQDLEDQLAGDDVAPALQPPAAQLPPISTRNFSATGPGLSGEIPDEASMPASADANTPPSLAEPSPGRSQGVGTGAEGRVGEAGTSPESPALSSENTKTVSGDRIAVVPLESSKAVLGSGTDTGSVIAEQSSGAVVPPLPVTGTGSAQSASAVGSPTGLDVAPELHVVSGQTVAAAGVAHSVVAAPASNSAESSERSAEAPELKRQLDLDLGSSVGTPSAAPIISGAAATAAVPPSSTVQKRAPPASADDLQLLKGSASNGRAGGSVYEMLVQELKQLKVQQKAFPRQLAELQRNISAAAAAGSRVASDLATVTARLASTEAALTSLATQQSPADADSLQVPESSLQRLEQRLVAAEQREMALLGLAAMLAGLTVSSMLQQRVIMPLFGSAVAVLSLANGVVGLVQYFDISEWRSKIPSL